jgi:hypothetical protein
MTQFLNGYLVRVIMVAASACNLPMIATAQDYPPYRGTLVGANDGDLLDFECSEINSDRIECSFVQVLLRTKSTQEEFEDSLASISDILKEMKTEVELCEFFVAYDKVVNGEIIQDPVMAEKIQRAIEERAKSNLKDQRSLEKVDLIDGALLALCKNPSTETARDFLAVSHDIEADVCEPLFNRYSQQFVRVSPGLWVVESSPSGECGIVNTSRFLADPKYPTLWNYEASKVITNKAGGEVIPCRGLDETPQPYFWNQGPVLKNCTFID